MRAGIKTVYTDERKIRPGKFARAAAAFLCAVLLMLAAAAAYIAFNSVAPAQLINTASAEAAADTAYAETVTKVKAEGTLRWSTGITKYPRRGRRIWSRFRRCSEIPWR